MPVFCIWCGADAYVCQMCWTNNCSKDLPATWMEPVPGKTYNGCICPACVIIIKAMEEDKHGGKT